jgi:hypothetical protein
MPTRHVQKFAEVKIRKFSICGGKIRKNATKIRQKSGKNADTIRKQKYIIKKSWIFLAIYKKIRNILLKRLENSTKIRLKSENINIKIRKFLRKSGYATRRPVNAAKILKKSLENPAKIWKFKVIEVKNPEISMIIR